MELPNHQNDSVKQKKSMQLIQCLFAFLGCQFVAGVVEMEAHLEKCIKHHLSLVGKFLCDRFHQDWNGLVLKNLKL